MDSSYRFSTGMVKKTTFGLEGFIITIDPEVLGLRNKTNSNMRCSKAQVCKYAKTGSGGEHHALASFLRS